MVKLSTAHGERIAAGLMPCVIHHVRRRQVHAGDELKLFTHQVAPKFQERIQPHPSLLSSLDGQPALVCTAVMPLTLVMAPPARMEGWYIMASIAPDRESPVVPLDLMEVIAMASREGLGDGLMARDRFAAMHFQKATSAPGCLPNTGIIQLEVIWWTPPENYGFTRDWWFRKSIAAGLPQPRAAQERIFSQQGNSLVEGGGEALAAWRKQSHARSRRARFATRTNSEPAPPSSGENRRKANPEPRHLV